MNVIRILMTSFVILMFIYSAHQLTRFTDLPAWGTALIIGFLFLLFAFVLGTFAYSFKNRHRGKGVPDRAMNLSLTIMAYINFLLSFLILRDIIAFVQSFVLGRETEQIYGATATYGMLALPIVFLLLGNLVIRLGAKVKTVKLDFPQLPDDLDGLRIVHLTDLHIGPSVSLNFVRKVVQKVNSLNPDLIVFTGDILDDHAERHRAEQKLISNLKSKHGIFYVTGNHEYYWNGKNALAYFEEAGFEILQNQVEDIYIKNATIQMAGINDPAATRFGMQGPDFQAVQGNLRPDSFKILLSHQPSLCHESEKIGADLQLSGHTHGGQFFPWNLLIVFFERYAKGLYHIGKMQLYVNQGTGYWGPQLRLGTYCELAEIVLRKSPKKE